MDAADLFCSGHRPSGFLPGDKQTFAVHGSQAQSVAYGQILALPGSRATAYSLGRAQVNLGFREGVLLRGQPCSMGT